MFSFTSRNVNFITLVLTIVTFFSMQNLIININGSAENKIQNNQIVSNNVVNNNAVLNNVLTNNNTKNIIKTNVVTNKINIVSNTIAKTNNTQSAKLKETPKTYENIWEISIPKINLTAQISNGTTKEVMDKYVGHFDISDIWDGNVALAAHNRGYKVNYFQNIKTLEKGDLIIYKTKYGTRKYKVEIIQIVKDTNWTYLETTKDNRITLITCVENKPEQRRCIQGIEIK